jgi:hypothetical protein
MARQSPCVAEVQAGCSPMTRHLSRWRGSEEAIGNERNPWENNISLPQRTWHDMEIELLRRSTTEKDITQKNSLQFSSPSLNPVYFLFYYQENVSVYWDNICINWATNIPENIPTLRRPTWYVFLNCCIFSSDILNENYEHLVENQCSPGFHANSNISWDVGVNVIYQVVVWQWMRATFAKYDHSATECNRIWHLLQSLQYLPSTSTAFQLKVTLEYMYVFNFCPMLNVKYSTNTIHIKDKTASQ